MPAPEFQPYVGSAVTTGSGGTLVRRGNIDVWTTGTPPRRFKILGVIEEVGDNYSTRDSVLRDCARAAERLNADGVMIMGRSGASIKVAVIKYL